MKYLQFFAITLFVSTLISCNSDDGEKENDKVAFDRAAMLENWADNIIIPSFENFASFTADLEAKTEVFCRILPKLL
jgi:hypothetical protein